MHLTSKGLSQRSGCRWSGISRSAARYPVRQAARDTQLVEVMRQVTAQPPRFGYTCTALRALQCRCRRVAVLAQVSFKRAWRVWKQHGFALQPLRTRRRRTVRRDDRPHHATGRNHVWTYDILYDRLANGRPFKTLSILDEFTRNVWRFMWRRRCERPT